jgi:hypothetical protein
VPDWIGAHVRALASWAAPAQLVPDNPKVGIRANWYEPGLNRTYLDLATHYGTAILPTRTRKPHDNARSRSPYWSSSAGSWRGCGTGASCRWPS